MRRKVGYAHESQAATRKRITTVFPATVSTSGGDWRMQSAQLCVERINTLEALGWIRIDCLLHDVKKCGWQVWTLVAERDPRSGGVHYRHPGPLRRAPGTIR